MSDYILHLNTGFSYDIACHQWSLISWNNATCERAPGSCLIVDTECSVLLPNKWNPPQYKILSQYIFPFFLICFPKTNLNVVLPPTFRSTEWSFSNNSVSISCLQMSTILLPRDVMYWSLNSTLSNKLTCSLNLSFLNFLARGKFCVKGETRRYWSRRSFSQAFRMNAKIVPANRPQTLSFPSSPFHRALSFSYLRLRKITSTVDSAMLNNVGKISQWAYMWRRRKSMDDVKMLTYLQCRVYLSQHSNPFRC